MAATETDVRRDRQQRSLGEGGHRSAGRPDSQDWDGEPPRRRHLTFLQRAGGVVLALLCLGIVVWYVPKIASADSRSVTGTVISTGVVDLNFAGSGRIGLISTHIGQTVKRGQLLAAESDPTANALVASARSAVRADKARIADLQANPATGSTDAGAAASQAAHLATAQAQLSKDQAALASDRLRISGTKIIAPAAGQVVAVNGLTGESVSSYGIRDYSVQGGVSNTQPAFSLIPEGPQSGVQSSSAASALPVVALRTSSSWQAALFIPEASVSAVRIGERVLLSVPAAHLAGIHGEIRELSPQPVTTSGGVYYQAVISVSGRSRMAPLSGMAVSAQLDS